MQLGSQQREPFLDLLELLPPDRAFPTPAAQHLAPVTLHSTMDLQQCPDVPGNAVVCIVTTQHLIEVLVLLPERRVPHPPHLVLQAHERTSQSRLICTQPHPKVAFPIAGAVQRETQKINRLWAPAATLARPLLRIATEFDEFGLLRFQGQAKLPQSFAQRILDAKRILAILKAQHKVVDVSHQIGLASQPRLDHSFEPQIEHVVEIHVTQQYADRPSLWSTFFVRMEFLIFQNLCFQPASDQANQTRVAYSMLHKAEHPFVTQASEKVL